MRRIRAVSLFPTIFTLGNLVCGFFAIVVASRIPQPTDLPIGPAPKLESARALIQSLDPTQNLMLCGLLIFFAMIFDVFDGQVARMAKVTSDFGNQLDSLCDLVSFGIAPGILMVKMCPQFAEDHHEASWCIAAFYACCAAMRLARFNVETDEDDDHSWFEGLPSPAAAAIIASSAILCYRMRGELYVRFEDFDSWLQRLCLLTLVVALLMVSRVPYPHAVTHALRGRESFPRFVGIVLALMALWVVRWYAVPVASAAYALGPPVYHGWTWTWRRWPTAQKRRGSGVFTGLVQGLGEVGSVTPEGPGVRLVVRNAATAARAAIGDSIAINGCCLTVVAVDGEQLAFEAGAETLRRTNLGRLRPGDRVNLEASLRVGDALGGHLVTGHVDGLGTVDAREDDAAWCTMWFRTSPELLRQMASKGSVAIDGVSLTLVDVTDPRFSVALIPHTLDVTTLGQRRVGDEVNLETDVLAKYVERQLAGRVASL